MVPSTSAKHVQTDAVVTLFAEQTIPAGTVTVSHDNSFLCIEYDTTDGWELVQTHPAGGLMRRPA